jgi:broad specificity phosphatase PhoE
VRLILVRHGESQWNREGRILGRADIPLSGVGRRQAHAVAKALQEEKVQSVYCSPLRRAMETASIIAKTHGCPLLPDPDLQELGRGNLEGMTREAALKAYPDLQKTWPEVAGVMGLYGQESLEELDVRVRRCMNRIMVAQTRGTVAVVGHYFVNLLIVLSLLDMRLQSFPLLGQDIAAISLVEIRGSLPVLRRLNDTCHLLEG